MYWQINVTKLIFIIMFIVQLIFSYNIQNIDIYICFVQIDLRRIDLNVVDFRPNHVRKIDLRSLDKLIFDEWFCYNRLCQYV